MTEYLLYFFLDVSIILCTLLTVFSWQRFQIFASSFAFSLLLLALVYVSYPSSIFFYFFAVFIVLDFVLLALIGAVELFCVGKGSGQQNKSVTILLLALIIAATTWLIYFVNFEDYVFPETNTSQSFIEKFGASINSLWGPGFLILLLLGVLMAVVMLGSLSMARIRKLNE